MAASWSRRRLQLRSALSATMPIGWIWVAATALIPYFLIGRGPGAGSLEYLGVARTTWLSLHVWSSISVGMATVAHGLLNRRGVARSYRIIGGSSRSASEASPKGWTWVAALALLLVTLGGSVAFAAVDGRAGNTGSRSAVERSDDDPERSTARGGDAGRGGGGQHRQRAGQG